MALVSLQPRLWTFAAVRYGNHGNIVAGWAEPCWRTAGQKSSEGGGQLWTCFELLSDWTPSIDSSFVEQPIDRAIRSIGAPFNDSTDQNMAAFTGPLAHGAAPDAGRPAHYIWLRFKTEPW